jgi:hypothetical protein
MGDWMIGSSFSLTSSLVGGDWSDSRSGRITHDRRWVWGQMDLRITLNDVEKIRIFALTRLELRSLGSPASSQLLYRLPDLGDRRISRRMPSSWMWRRVSLVRTDVSEELSAFIIRVTRIGKLGPTLAVTSNRRTLRRNSFHPDDGDCKFLLNVGSYKAHTAKTPEDGILHSHRRENFKSYRWISRSPYGISIHQATALIHWRQYFYLSHCRGWEDHWPCVMAGRPAGM